MKKLTLLLLLPYLIVSNVFGSNSNKKDDKALKILSWNIHMLPYMIFAKSDKKERESNISEYLKESDYNIIVFQEAFKQRIRKRLKKHLKEKYPYTYGPANWKFLSLKTNSGIMIFSDRPLIEKGEVQFDVCTGADCLARKGSILVEGEHNGHLFQIAGTHANAGGSRIMKNHQYHQIYDGLLYKYQKQGVPQFICGDMNRSMSNKRQYKEMLQIFDAEDGPLGGERQYTNYQKSGIIDYILLRRNGSDIKSIKKTVPTIGPDYDPKIEKYKPGGMSWSDHFPVDITIVFEEN